MSEVRFDGPGPYDLPLVQAIRAYAEANRVAVTISVPVRGHLEVVRFQLARDQAVNFVPVLQSAIVDATKRR